METEELIRICRQSASLKAVPRTGWLLAIGVGEYESVADHSWGVGLVSLLLAQSYTGSDQKLDIERMLKMAILHDLPETVISDIPQTAVSHAQDALPTAKHAAESSAFRHLIGYSAAGSDLARVWEEYHDGKSLEARIVSAADVIDMLVYASLLEKTGVSPSLFDQFYVSGGERIASLGIEQATEVCLVLETEHFKRIQK